MGYPRYHEQPTLLLLNRTLTNLDFVERHKHHDGPFEVTQLLNSFAGVLAHPWDSLLDKNSLEKKKSNEFYAFGFPELKRLPTPVNQIVIPNLYEYLRTLRNGMAHGNFELLDRKQLREYGSDIPLPNVKESEIAGIKIWNVANRDLPDEKVTWCAVASIRDLKLILHTMLRLCLDENCWRSEVREAHQTKREARKGKKFA